jgi:large subunit ribosomal protein L4
MKLEVKTLDNKVVGEVTLPEDVFGFEARTDIIARVIHWQLAKRRSGTHSTKHIQDVSGTTRKPFRQKGTGRARQGSLRATQMRGGGIMHGPQPRDHGYALPKKIRALGLKSALSQKIAEKKVIVLENFTHKSGKTKDLLHKLEKMGLQSALFIDGLSVDQGILRAVSNMIKINVLPSQGANVYDIIRHDTLVLSKEAVKNLETRLK